MVGSCEYNNATLESIILGEFLDHLEIDSQILKENSCCMELLCVHARKIKNIVVTFSFYVLCLHISSLNILAPALLARAKDGDTQV